MQRTSRIRPFVLLIACLLISRLLFIAFMPAVYSKDLAAWLRVMDILERGGNPYGETSVLNWPPFWMQILYVVHKFSLHTGLPRWPLVQAVLIAAEVVVLSLTWFIGLRYFNGKRLFRALLLGISLNPISIFLSCQHCNYDVFVGLWVVLAAWALIKYSTSAERDAWLMACFFIGLGILTKTVPIILIPLLFIGIRRLPLATILFGAVLLLSPVIIGMSVLYVLEPLGVKTNVLGYRSMGGWYGFTGIFNMLHSWDAIVFYQKLSPFLFLSVIGFTSWKCYRTVSASAQQIITTMLLLLLFITTFGPGYSPPYILWYLPLLVLFYAFTTKALRRLLTIAWIIGVLTYTFEYAIFSSHGAFLLEWYHSLNMMEWSDYLGDSLRQPMIRMPMFICYLVLFGTMIVYLRGLSGHGEPASYKTDAAQPAPVEKQAVP